MRSFAIFAMGTFLFANSAAGQVCKSKDAAMVIKPGRNGEWAALVEKKLYDEATRCCVSCMIDAGTQFVITDKGFLSSTVRVIEGPKTGCTGDLPREYIDCRD